MKERKDNRDSYPERDQQPDPRRSGPVGLNLDEYDLDAYYEEKLNDFARSERRKSDFDRALDSSFKKKKAKKIVQEEPVKEEVFLDEEITEADNSFKETDSLEIVEKDDSVLETELIDNVEEDLTEVITDDLVEDGEPVETTVVEEFISEEDVSQEEDIEEVTQIEEESSEGEISIEFLDEDVDQSDVEKVEIEDDTEDSEQVEDYSDDKLVASQELEADDSKEAFSNKLKGLFDKDDSKEVSEESEEEISQDSLEELGQTISQNTQQFTQPLLTDEMLGRVNLPTEEQLESDTAQLEHPNEETDGDTVVEGATWLTAGSIISRILGAIYIIPWAAWLGAEYSQAASLYSIGYKYYALFLAVATAGIPSAISKQMAYYQSQKEFKAADQLFKAAAILMIISGVVSGALLYFLAPSFAAQSPTNNPESAVLVIRSLVPALLILPLVSLFRGYFQGFNDMKPSAVSQIIEQVVRVVYILGSTYAILKIYNGTVTSAVVHSTFAAFVGAAACFIYLLILFARRYPTVKKLIDNSKESVELDFGQSLKIIIKDSIPFILLGSGITIMQVIDTFTFKPILMNTTTLLAIEINDIYAAFSLNVDKLSMILVSIGVALSTSLVPVVTEHYAKGDLEKTSEVITQVLLVFSFVMFPAAMGMASVSDNLYAFFYSGVTDWESRLMVTGALTSIILGLYSVLSMVLQSMGFRRMAIRFLFIGIITKLVLQVPLVAWFNGHGALISTALGLLVSSILMWIKIERELEIDKYYLKSQLKLITATSLIMWLACGLWNNVLNRFIGDGRWMCLLKVILVAVLGVVLYLGLSALTGTLKILLGDRFKELQEKLRLL